MDQAQIRSQLPKHLQQFVANQDYDTRYSAKDQAVWRLVMKQLVKQLKDFKSGTRVDPVMKPMAAMLSDQDMENIAAFYESLKQ